MKEWEARFLDPDRYPYRPSRKPHPFMGLNKFDAGRLHQARSGKSYLRAHPSRNDDRPTICPRCEEAPESFKHAVLSCPTREPVIVRHLQGVYDLGPDTPVWSSTILLAALAGYMRFMLTAFPRACLFTHHLLPVLVLPILPL